MKSMKIIQPAFLPTFLLLCLFAASTTAAKGGEEDPNHDATRKLETCSSSPKVADVTVVGGGLAGIFAASVLKLRGKSYHLLESSDKWGGRLRSSEAFELFENGVVEDGAQFMYGKNRGKFRVNPIWKLFQNFGMDTVDYDDTNWDAYDDIGNSIPDKDVSRSQRQFRRSVRKCLDGSGNEWFEEFVQGVLTPDENAKSLLETCMPKRFQWFNDSPLKSAVSHVLGGETENALPLDEISRASYPEDSVDVFGPSLFIQTDQVGGSSAMIDALVAYNLDPDQIELRTRVTNIEYTITGTPMVTTTADVLDGDGNVECEQVYQSEYVIVTAPINVLREQAASNMITFDPSIDDAILDKHPIEQVEVEKVWIKFGSSFWDTSRHWVVVTNELADGASTVFFNYDRVFPGSNLLLTFVRKSQREAMPGQVIDVDKVISGLKKLPGYNDPPKFRVTTWKDDPNFAGSWEVWKSGAGTYFDFEEASQPQGNLHTAGAAWCLNFYGFTWGAIFSGIFEAEYVANRLDGSTEVPYTPCTDQGNINNRDMKDFYQKYGSLFGD